MDDEERTKVEARLGILERQLGALRSWSAVVDCVWKSSDRVAAHRLLQSELGFDEIVAHYVLDMPTSRTTRQARAQMAEEAAELGRQLTRDA
ncbi:MAG: hypothetical protein AAGA59_25235 [Actinomycetota bacterium]